MGRLVWKADDKDFRVFEKVWPKVTLDLDNLYGTRLIRSLKEPA